LKKALHVRHLKFSAHQQRVLDWVSAHAHVRHWAYEATALPGWRHPVDIWLGECKLAVQVDGEQHFEGAMHGMEAATQLQQDFACNAAGWGAGGRLVRMHYADLGPKGFKVLSATIKYARAHPNASMLVLTWSFKNVFVGGMHRIGGHAPYPAAMAAVLGLPPPMHNYGCTEASCWLTS
jgi:hypothetical protein